MREQFPRFTVIEIPVSFFVVQTRIKQELSNLLDD